MAHTPIDTMRIVNPWHDPNNQYSRLYFEAPMLNEIPLITIGDYSIHVCDYGASHISVYKGVAISQLVGCNEILLHALSNGVQPTGTNAFLYDRAKKIVLRVDNGEL